MTTLTPHVAVVGAGANGASIGADLMLAGVDVTLIEQWPAHVEAMRGKGLHVRYPDDEVMVRPRALHLCEVAELRETFDVVLLLMKAYDTRWSVELIRPVLAEEGLVAGVQNGMTTSTIADVVGAERTMGTVIEVASTMYDPGVVDRHTPGDRSWFAVGGSGFATGREGEIAAVLRHCGRVEVVEDILATKWMKLVSNCTTLVTTALTGLPMIDALAVPDLRQLMIRSGQEALDVGAAQGYAVLPIFGLAPEDVIHRETLVETLLDTLYDGFVLPGTSTTVAQDWDKGRRSEAKDLNGEAARLGRALGIPTPVNDAVMELAHRVERGALAPSPDNVVLLQRLLEEEDDVRGRAG